LVPDQEAGTEKVTIQCTQKALAQPAQDLVISFLSKNSGSWGGTLNKVHLSAESFPFFAKQLLVLRIQPVLATSKL